MMEATPTTTTTTSSKCQVPVEQNGLARLHRVFTVKNNVEGMTQELYEMVVINVLAFGCGAIYGGLPASRHAKYRFIDMTNIDVYNHRIEAVRAAQNAGSRGFIRYGFRWGWRTAVIAGGFHFLSTVLAIYRDKQDLLNYTFASGTIGGLYRFNLGLRGLVGGTFAGLVVGIPAGLVLSGIQKLVGETNLERYRRIRVQKAEEHWQELEMRKQVMPLMLDYMEIELKKKNLIPTNIEEGT